MPNALRIGMLSLALAMCVSPAAGFAADFSIPPTPDHHVVDTAAALSPTTRNTLENELQSYETATGHQIVVWIGQTTGDVPLETWTGETADHWKIGRRGHDDGAVLFVFMRDHKLRIEVGYGLESALTDADSKRIIEAQIVPVMRAGDTDGAITNGVGAILTTITPSYTVASSAPQAAPEAIGSDANAAVIGMTLLIFGFLIFIAIVTVIGNIRYGYLVMREGSTAARADMRRWWFLGSSGFGAGFFSSGGGFGGGGFGGGFSAGGGGFGGGGASGGW